MFRTPSLEARWMFRTPSFEARWMFRTPSFEARRMFRTPPLQAGISWGWAAEGPAVSRRQCPSGWCNARPVSGSNT